MNAKKWEREDVDFLEENWGELTIKIIAKKLNRTEKAIVSKSIRLGLSKLSYYSEDITFHQLCIGLGKEGNYGYYKKKFINTDFPFKEKKMSSTRNKKVLMVNINQFWKWIQRNQHQIDFSEFERGMLGKEPEWVEGKRNNDLMKKRKILTRKWTKADDTRLIDLVNRYEYTYQEIANRLMRSHGAIIRRLNELGMKGRPVRESAQSKWGSKQLDDLKNMILKRVSYCQMTEIINKSEKAIRGKVYVLFGSENIDRAANNILQRNL